MCMDPGKSCLKIVIFGMSGSHYCAHFVQFPHKKVVLQTVRCLWMCSSHHRKADSQTECTNHKTKRDVNTGKNDSTMFNTDLSSLIFTSRNSISDQGTMNINDTEASQKKNENWNAGVSTHFPPFEKKRDFKWLEKTDINVDTQEEKPCVLTTFWGVDVIVIIGETQIQRLWWCFHLFLFNRLKVIRKKMYTAPHPPC